MKISKLIRRFFIPSIVVSVYYFLKYRCKVSTRAEVELNSNLVIGKNTQISSFTKIKASDGPLVIGRDCSIGTGSSIGSQAGGIYIGNDCLIGNNVCIIGNSYKFDKLDVPFRIQGHKSIGVKIADNVFIGSGAVINDGVEIGSGAMVTPNSFVTGKIPENAIVQGAPAKVVFIRR